MVTAVRERRSYLALYVCGIAGHAVGFHWVLGTVSAFGGFGFLASLSIFALFVLTGALQFLLFAALDRHLGTWLDPFALRAAVAWVLAELVTPRLFGWNLGHTQIAFTALVQCAGLAGSLFVSFLMVWIAEVGVRILLLGERRRGFVVPLLAFGMALAYGFATIRTFSAPRGEPLDVVLVQADARVTERHDAESAHEYLARLYALTRRTPHPGALVVWPEGAVPANIPDSVRSVDETNALPWLPDGSALILGSYAFDAERRRYNAAFAVGADGSVPPPYFKRVLIPFGESMPFASVLPGLERLNANATVFTPGDQPRVFALGLRANGERTRTVRVSPLICYEDTLPRLGREATLAGAEVLVNLTSDAWFGRSAALPQHHRIASFRAIENRRYLVRATTTGLTAVVDPLGRTVAAVPPYAEGTATARVIPLTIHSTYTYAVGDAPWWALLAGFVTVSALRQLRRRGRPRAAK
jgi:apolipoprotein N-acyltransferase